MDGRDCTEWLPGGLPEPGQTQKEPCICIIPVCVKAICLRQTAHIGEDTNFAIFEFPATLIAERTAPGTTCAVSTRKSSPFGAVRDLIASVGSLSIIIISEDEDATGTADDDGKDKENPNDNDEEATDNAADDADDNTDGGPWPAPPSSPGSAHSPSIIISVHSKMNTFAIYRRIGSITTH